MSLHADDLVGQTIGGYKLDRALGTGGAGTVYLAHEIVQPDTIVAIKVLMPAAATAAEREEFRKRFIREAETLAELHHPHILPIYQLGLPFQSQADEATGEFIYMVMPYIGGGTLIDRLEHGPLPLPQAMNYIRQLADALDYAHEHHVIHRDLKPANVLIDDQDHVYLADFGSAKVLSTSTASVTNVNQIVGTPAYMAPEQIADQPVGPATDVYGLGMLAYHMITGKLPFDAPSLLGTLRQIALDEPVSPRDERPELPLPAAEVILRALAKTPEQRFPSATAFASALERGLQNRHMTPSPQSILAQFPVDGDQFAQADAAPAPWIPPARPRRPSRRAMILIASALLLALVSLGLISAHFGQRVSLVKTAAELTQIATSTQGIATVQAVAKTALPPNAPPPKNQATQIAIATQVASGTQPPQGTQNPSATQTPSLLHTPTPTKVPPTATPRPTATPIPGRLDASNSFFSLSPNNFGTPFVACDSNDFQNVKTTLTNVGGSTISWSQSLSEPPGGQGGGGFNPGSGTLAPNQSVQLQGSGFLKQGTSFTATFGSQATVTVQCG
jgi:serine/threonine protein kinase